MRVRVKLIGIPQPAPGFEGRKEVSIDIPGDSVKDFIDQLIPRMGSENRKFFVSDHGDIVASDLMIIVNGIATSGSNQADLQLKENDLVELVLAFG